MAERVAAGRVRHPAARPRPRRGDCQPARAQKVRRGARDWAELGVGSEEFALPVFAARHPALPHERTRWTVHESGSHDLFDAVTNSKEKRFGALHCKKHAEGLLVGAVGVECVLRALNHSVAKTEAGERVSSLTVRAVPVGRFVVTGVERSAPFTVVRARKLQDVPPASLSEQANTAIVEQQVAECIDETLDLVPVCMPGINDGDDDFCLDEEDPLMLWRPRFGDDSQGPPPSVLEPARRELYSFAAAKAAELDDDQLQECLQTTSALRRLKVAHEALTESRNALAARASVYRFLRERRGGA